MKHATPVAALFFITLLNLATPAYADDATPPLAMPSDASAINYDGESGSLTFSSAMPVKELADFYRDLAKQQGWQEQPSVIKQDNMAVLTFMTKGDDVATITVMKMGDQSQVVAEGKALETKAEATAEAGSAPAADAAPPLVAIDKDGLPIPDGLGNMGSTRTQFSHAVNFSAPNSVADIVAFYRTELGKKGWKEDAAKIQGEDAEVKFTSPDGPATLTVKRNGDMTDAELTVTEKSKAAASPLAPKAGMVKLIFGNMSDNPAEVTVAGKKIKLAPGQGSKGPDGPTLDVKPGELTATMKGAKETFTAGPDEIWMVGVGPGGLITMKQ
jgi:hypothetical protein